MGLMRKAALFTHLAALLCGECENWHTAHELGRIAAQGYGVQQRIDNNCQSCKKTLEVLATASTMQSTAGNCLQLEGAVKQQFRSACSTAKMRSSTSPRWLSVQQHSLVMCYTVKIDTARAAAVSAVLLEQQLPACSTDYCTQAQTAATMSSDHYRHLLCN
eukprot:7529-Heterococcus_DN1.PRE.2